MGRSHASQLGHYSGTQLVLPLFANRDRQASCAATCSVHDGDEIWIVGGGSLAISNEQIDGFLCLRRKEVD
mgnify:FL=1